MPSYVSSHVFDSALSLPTISTSSTAHGRDRLTFLDQTCMRAGLASGCWKDPKIQVNIFSAEIFSEKYEDLPS
ncbi:MAG: AMMECR1 family protein [Deltaproteobacteria bacterium]|nr:AMMECR1 family protein [Deltaproteobacteria bacterium]MDL1960941.1 AMMECR1 family protein [Deltaproteobacteria bacterium]